LYIRENFHFILPEIQLLHVIIIGTTNNASSSRRH
jgi:hypothetical protein